MARAAYPIGTAGVAWGAAEKAQWLATRTVERSYQAEVLTKIDALKDRFVVEQYGALSHDPARYPLFAAKTKSWQAGKPCVLVTGGVHGWAPQHASRYPWKLYFPVHFPLVLVDLAFFGTEVHGYETSGVQGALLFLDTQAEAYSEQFNILVAPCEPRSGELR